MPQALAAAVFNLWLACSHCNDLKGDRVKPLEQFTHATPTVAQLELLLDPADCFGSSAIITIEPGRELLLLLVSHPSVAADIAEARECLFATSNIHSNSALKGFGMDMEDATDCIGILTTVEQEDGVQALGDTTIIGLLEATPHILVSGTAQGD